MYVNTLKDGRIVSTTNSKNGTMQIQIPQTNNIDLIFGTNYGVQSEIDLRCSVVLSDGRLLTCFRVYLFTIMNIWNIVTENVK